VQPASTPFNIVRRLQQAQLRLAAAALVALMLVTCADVFMRYLFNRPVRGAYELVECLMLVFVFHGMAAAFFGRRHIVIDLMDSFVGARFVTFFIRLADVLSVLCLGLIFWAMLWPMVQAYQYNDIKIETRIPVYWLWLVALAGIAGSLLSAAIVLFAKPAVPETGRTE
jgi:TRAP-type C4-dicarboxylate transport system permease small subunit